MTTLTHTLRGRTRYPGKVNPNFFTPGLLTTKTASGKTTSQTGSYLHTVDVDTNLLVVLWASSTNNETSQMTSITAGGTAMTIAAQYGANYQGAGVAYLQNPAAGSLSIAWTCNSGINGSSGMYLYAMNFLTGSATPFSAQTADGNISHSHSAVIGNYAVEAIRNANNLSPTDGQTLILQAQSPYYAFAYKLITATGTEALSWSGTQSYAGHASAIIQL